jgi:hypothetical protein
MSVRRRCACGVLYLGRVYGIRVYPKPPVPVLNAEEIFRTRADQRAKLETILAQRSDRRRAGEVAAEVRLAREALGGGRR